MAIYGTFFCIYYFTFTILHLLFCTYYYDERSVCLELGSILQCLLTVNKFAKKHINFQLVVSGKNS